MAYKCRDLLLMHITSKAGNGRLYFLWFLRDLGSCHLSPPYHKVLETSKGFSAARQQIHREKGLVQKFRDQAWRTHIIQAHSRLRSNKKGTLPKFCFISQCLQRYLTYKYSSAFQFIIYQMLKSGLLLCIFKALITRTLSFLSSQISSYSRLRLGVIFNLF